MIPAVDISVYQGAWQDYPADIVLIKMSGGDAGLYMDPDAATNYSAAKAAGKHVGGYHFGGGTNPVAEATYFMQAMSPLEEGDVYALDCERGAATTPDWALQFVNAVHTKIGVWPLVYMSLSTLRSSDWSAVLANCGLWLADWNDDPAGTIPNVPTYVMQQYSDGPNYDHDEWFGSVAGFDACGWHAPQAAPDPAAPQQAPAAQAAPEVSPTPHLAPAATTSSPVHTTAVSKPLVPAQVHTVRLTPTTTPTALAPQPASAASTAVSSPADAASPATVGKPSVNWLVTFFRWLKRILHL